MQAGTYPPLAITQYWAGMHEQFLYLIDVVPEDKWDWSPKPELWNFRGTLVHIANARHIWMTRDVQDGEATPQVFDGPLEKEDLKRHLRVSWERLQRFLYDPAKLAATYNRTAEMPGITGHWIAFHGLEHDIHHRADIFHYLALLDIETPEVSTP